MSTKKAVLPPPVVPDPKTPQIILVRRSARLDKATKQAFAKAGFLLVYGNKEDFAALDVMPMASLNAMLTAALGAIRNASDYNIRGQFVNRWIDLTAPHLYTSKP